MAKTATSTSPELVRTCPKCSNPLTKLGRKWVCEKCLQASFLTHEAQKKAAKRWRESEKGKKAVQTYEKGKGKTARERYLKSEKYKQRRREYNQRLKESLEIARAVRKEAMQTLGPEMIKQKMSALTRDIKDYMSWGTRLKLEEVQEWAISYNLTITPEQAQELIQKAKEL